MSRGRQNRIIMIAALCISVVGLTLGFAAFSNVLTISSGATVSPNRSDFKLVVYGPDTDLDVDDDFVTNGSIYANPDFYTSNDIVKPYARNLYISSNVSATDAIIESNIDSNGNTNISISNLHANLEADADQVTYHFAIKNEGKYDAYLLAEQVDALRNMNDSIVCKPVIEEGKSPATESLVDAACDYIQVSLTITDNNGQSMHSSWPQSIDAFKLDKYGANNQYGYGYAILILNILYSARYGNFVLADGDFYVEIPEINLEFTTTPPAA